MSFSPRVREDVLVACKRHCCLCEEYKALKIEIHHIKQKCEGGSDTFDNAIPLCFDCHGDMRSYDHKHPKGAKYSENELKRRRDGWYLRAEALSVPSRSQTSYIAQISNHDISIFQELNNILPSNYCSILRQSAFGDHRTGELLEPFYNFLEKCNDPTFMFQDHEFEQEKNILKEKADSLINYVSPYMESAGSNMYRIGPTEGSLGSDIEQMNYWSGIISKAWDYVSSFCESYDNLLRQKTMKL